MHESVPTLPRKDMEFRLHGEEWTDPYEWVRGETEEALRLEEEYASRHLERYEDAARRLAEAVKDDVVESEFGIPQRQGDWWFVPDLAPGARHPRILRIRAEGMEPPGRDRIDAGDAQVLIDFDDVLPGSYVGVGSVHLSPCERYVAWTEDSTGGESYAVRLRELSTGREIDTGLDGVSSSIVFSQDGDSFFAVHLDSKNRPCEVTRHRTESPRDSVSVFQEEDERFRVRVSRSSSGELVFVTAASRGVTKNFYLVADDPSNRLIGIDGIADDESATCAHVSCGDGHFLALTVTSPSCPDGALLLAPLREDRTPAPREEWLTLLAHSEDRRLASALALRDHLLVGVRHNGRNVVLTARCADLGSGGARFTAIDPWGDADINLAMTPEWDAEEILVARTSLVQKLSLYRVRIDEPTAAHRIGPQPPESPVPYVEEQIHAKAEDGQDVPITVVRRADGPPKAPVLLCGYGAYDANVGRRYNPMLLRLVDAGVVYAFAPVRGGGEKGSGWHEAARGLGKPRSFTDFLACRDELVARGLADPPRIVAMGGSAGGLLVAASLNADPAAFCGVVADVPFVDPLTTMMKPELPLTISDRKEWGDPLEDPDIARCIRSYSPYHNVRPVEYPPVLATCGSDDSRVSAVEPLKWINRLRHDATGGPFLLRVRSGGHVGNSTIDDGLREQALEYVWIADRLGVRLSAGS